MPGERAGRAVGEVELDALRLHLRGSPRDRRALLARLAAVLAVLGVVAELGFEELEGVAGRRAASSVAHEVGHDAARLLARVSPDVEPLEVVAIAGEGLDLRLRGRAAQGEGALGDRGRARDLDDRADAAEPLEVARREVEHAHAVAEGAALVGDDVVVARGVGGDGGEPLQRAFFVELNTEALGRLDDAGQVVVRRVAGVLTGVGGGGVGGGCGAHR